MKKFLSLVLALVMTMSLVTIGAGAKDFTDGSSIDYDVAVKVMSEVKVIDGYADGSFNPTATLTRGAAAKIICNLILGPTTAGALKADVAPYKDVPANSTFAGYIAYCQKEGIISGYADGTFKPGASLTGYAFMKMLLGALGYDATNEGYTGANWSINVAKRALSVGLDDDLAEDFDGTKPVTRQEACLYAFNTLQATMVEYKNASTIVVGDITVTSTSKASDLEWTGAERAYNGVYDNKIQFCEKFFSKLDATAGTDKLGRPITTWKYDKGDGIDEVKKADAVYSAKPESKDVYNDVGLSAATGFYYYVDGVKQNAGNPYFITKVDEDVAIPQLGDGVNVEVFRDKDDADKNTIAIYYTYAGKVTKIGTNSDDNREATVTVYNGSTTRSLGSNGNKFETEEFAKDDIVLVTVGRDGSNDKIVALDSTEKLTGTVTKMAGSDTFYIDGTKYKANAVARIDSNVGAGDEVEFYLDNNGYIVKIDETNSNNIDDLAYVYSTGTSRGVDWAKLYLTNGTKKTVDLDDDEVLGAAFDGGHIVKYKTNKDGLVEHLALDNYFYYSSTASNPYYLTKGVTEVKYDDGSSIVGTGIKMNGKTTIMVIDGTDITMYTGVANIPALQATSISVSWKNTDTTSDPAQLIVVHAVSGSVENSNAKLKLFGIKKNEDVVTVDGVSPYHEILDIKTGETVALKQTATGGFSIAVNNIYVAKSYATNGDNQINSLTRADDGKFYYATTGTAKIAGDTITVANAYSVSGVTAVEKSNYINSDVAVYVVSKKLDEVTDTWTLEDVAELDETLGEDYQQVLFTLDNDGYVDAIVLVKQK